MTRHDLMSQHISSHDVLPWMINCDWQRKRALQHFKLVSGEHIAFFCFFFEEVLHHYCCCFCETRLNLVIKPKRILKTLFVLKETSFFLGCWSHISLIGCIGKLSSSPFTFTLYHPRSDWIQHMNLLALEPGASYLASLCSVFSTVKVSNNNISHS